MQRPKGTRPPTERFVYRVLSALGLERIPNAEAVRRLREAARYHELRALHLRTFAHEVEAVFGGSCGPLTIHDLSDGADGVRARQRLA